MENSPSSQLVLKVSAEDPDQGANGQVSYSLHGPNADQFHLDYRTGTTGSGSGASLIPGFLSLSRLFVVLTN